jgi:hypothetical protein
MMALSDQKKKIITLASTCVSGNANICNEKWVRFWPGKKKN